MNLLKSTVVIFAAFLSLNVMANDWNLGCRNSHDISWAAHDLDRAAQHFHRVVHRMSGYSHLSSDIHRLANEARHLHRLADRGTRSCGHLRADFASVANAFRRL